MIYPVQTRLPGLDEEESSPEPDIREIDNFVDNPERWLAYFESALDWNRRMKSRYTYTFGYAYDPGRGICFIRKMPAYLHPVLQKVKREFGFVPNNCLLNYYPDGNHYIGFHADQGEEMKTGAGVVILSLGAVRIMMLRRIDKPDAKHCFPLKSGSAIHMKDEIQQTWEHGIPKQAGKGPRISLSFRYLAY